MLLLINLIILNSCGLFIKTLNVEVPSGYVGWCYVIPNQDSLMPFSPIVDGKYQADLNGIVLIPQSDFDIKKDHLIKVYDSGSDITKDIKYSSTVHKVWPSHNLNIKYFEFYLPPEDERKIAAYDEYWREKRDELYSIRDNLFDSLLKHKKLKL